MINNHKHIFWLICAIGIGIFLSSNIFSLIGVPKISMGENGGIEQASIIESPLFSGMQNDFEKKFYFIKDKNKKLSVSASAYLVGDIDTGEIIFSQKETDQFPIASVSKLMTALVSSEIIPSPLVAKVSNRALSTYGENGNFKIGEKIKVSDLYYPLLLESSNDAAEIIAEHFKRDTFIKKMNSLALKLDLSKTSFEDPSGLSPNNKSTVYDLFKLSGYIKEKKPELFQISAKKSYSNKIHSWFSNNQFLGEKGYLGGKSGFTEPAKQTAISLFSVPLGEVVARNIAITLLQSKDRYKDIQNILKYLNTNVYYGGESDANNSWVKQRTDLPPEYEKDYVDLLFVGDIMLDRGVKSSVNKNYAGDYSSLFEKTDILKKSDISFGNLEGPVSKRGKDMRNLYSFRMSPSVAPALKGAGISIVSLANNHIGDWGLQAFMDTMSLLEENEIHYIGAGRNKSEAEKPIVIEKYGIKVGFLGFSDVGPSSMEAKIERPGILLANDPRFEEIVKNASRQVDYLVVTFHFGEEYKIKHNIRQQYLAHKAIDNGAKIVIGTHPHVIEDIEVYKNGFIAYSLGNFIFDQKFSKNTMEGMILQIKLERDGGMTIKKNISKLNKFFQPEKIIIGKEEKIKFDN